MLLGFYGGTFNPIHRGHTHAALAVMRELELEEMRMVLSARPGHRRAPEVSSEHRWEMLQLACREHPGLVPDDTELRRDGSSFTVTTLESVLAEQPRAIPCWVLGQDSFATLPEWHAWDRLFDLANLVVLQRPGDVREEPAELAAQCAVRETAQLDRSRLGQIVRLTLPMLTLSSTRIRADIASGNDVLDLLEASVYTYIMEHELYRDAELAQE